MSRQERILMSPSLVCKYFPLKVPVFEAEAPGCNTTWCYHFNNHLHLFQILPPVQSGAYKPRLLEPTGWVQIPALPLPLGDLRILLYLTFQYLNFPIYKMG